jgi:hypothetical protein
MPIHIESREHANGTEWFIYEVAYMCPACGQAPDYCMGHGEMGDPEGYVIIEWHETGNHTRCSPNAECKIP